MAKTKEQLKKEYQILCTKLKELTDDELQQVTGGQFVVKEKSLFSTYRDADMAKEEE